MILVPIFVSEDPNGGRGAESFISGAIFSQIGILLTLLLHGWIVVDLALWHGPAMSRVRADHPVVDACYSLRFNNESWSVLLESLNLPLFFFLWFAWFLLLLVCVIVIIIKVAFSEFNWLWISWIFQKLMDERKVLEFSWLWISGIFQKLIDKRKVLELNWFWILGIFQKSPMNFFLKINWLWISEIFQNSMDRRKDQIIYLR